eukprot:tig00021441_g21546.t1
MPVELEALLSPCPIGEDGALAESDPAHPFDVRVVAAVCEGDPGEPATPAHRAVLAGRSAYFRAMLGGGWRESSGAGDVRVCGWSPAALRAVVRWAYAGDPGALPAGADELAELCRAEDFFGLPGFTEALEARALRSTPPAAACRLWRTAEDAGHEAVAGLARRALLRAADEAPGCAALGALPARLAASVLSDPSARLPSEAAAARLAARWRVPRGAPRHCDISRGLPPATLASALSALRRATNAVAADSVTPFASNPRLGPSSESYSLRGLRHVPGPALASLFESGRDRLPSLTELDLSGCALLDGESLVAICGALARRAAPLRRLDLSGCPQLHAAAIGHALLSLSSLQDLAIDDCPIAAPLLSPYERRRGSLLRLSARRADVPPKAAAKRPLVAGLLSAAGTRLAALDLREWRTPLLEEDAAALAERLRSGTLRELDLSGAWHEQTEADPGGDAAGGAAAAAAPLCAGLRGAPSLTTLRLGHCPFVSDDLVRAALRASPLRELSLRGTPISDAAFADAPPSSLSGLEALDLRETGIEGTTWLPGCRSLRSLNVRGCRGFRPPGPSWPGDASPLLEELKAGWGISDVHLASAPPLRALSLGLGTSATDSGLVPLVRRSGRRLRALRLSFARLSGRGLRAVILSVECNLDELGDRSPDRSSSEGEEEQTEGEEGGRKGEDVAEGPRPHALAPLLGEGGTGALRALRLDCGRWRGFCRGLPASWLSGLRSLRLFQCRDLTDEHLRSLRAAHLGPTGVPASFLEDLAALCPALRSALVDRCASFKAWPHDGR